MALIYFVILTCAFSKVLCHECINNPHVVSYLMGCIILLMLVIIIYLCMIVYKYKKELIATKITTVKDHDKIDSSTQTFDDITERKDMTKSAVSKTAQEKKPTQLVKKPISPGIPIFQKKQMDDLIKEVLNRQQKSESGSFRDLLALTKRKSTESVNRILGRKSLSLKKNEERGNSDDLYENLHNLTNSENKLSTSNDKTNIEDTNMNEECNEVYDVLPRPVVVTIDEVYDTVPNPRAMSDELYDSPQKSVLETKKDNDSESTEVYDTLSSVVVKCDDESEYDKLSNTKCYINLDNANPDHITVPVYDMPPGSSNTQTIVDSDTNYTLVIADEERQKLTRYVNANNIQT